MTKIIKITACLVIKNEEKVLYRCLNSIRNIVQEIIIVHDGDCTDRSIQIAKEFKAKIFVKPFVGEAEYHRPFSYQEAKGDWILHIDADEFLSADAQQEIHNLIKADDIDAYYFLWPYSVGGRYITRGPFAKTIKPCLFRKEKMYMLGISHEYPRTYGKLTKREDLLIEHKPEYNNFTRKSFNKKWKNWAKLQAEQIFNIEEAPKFNISELDLRKKFNHYFFMREHPIISGFEESLKFIAIYLSRGILWSGWQSLKIAYFELTYLWLIRLNLISLKHGKRI